MTQQPAVLAVDQGTTSTRAVIFNAQASACGSAQQEFKQHYPDDGWVEHAPDDLWQTTLTVIRDCLQQANEQQLHIQALGITNQRETTLVWDKTTGKPIYNAIVWQDRRTAAQCEQFAEQVSADWLQQRSGLLLDPYFSATKIAWILDHVDGARARAENGELAFGTVDSWLIWNLTGGKAHLTDATNACRTNLYNLTSGDWDDELLALFRVPRAMLPDIRDSSGDFGQLDKSLLEGIEGYAAASAPAIAITGVAGDQQAASVGQCCFERGQVKSTYGTGCFVLLNTGDELKFSSNRLLSTVALQLDGQRTFALEGSIFIAGAGVQWLRDELGIIEQAPDTETLARSLTSNQGVYLVPAFTGLGVPWWRADARGAIVGLTRGSGKAAIARAALEAVCYQTADLFDAMEKDGVRPNDLKVDGGMTANEWMLQFLADVLDVPVQRPELLETTSLGAAYLAGRAIGLYGSTSEFATLWRCSTETRPNIEDTHRSALLAGWHKAVERVMC